MVLGRRARSSQIERGEWQGPVIRASCHDPAHQFFATGAGREENATPDAMMPPVCMGSRGAASAAGAALPAYSLAQRPA